jgi:hypothetical protein
MSALDFGILLLPFPWYCCQGKGNQGDWKMVQQAPIMLLRWIPSVSVPITQLRKERFYRGRGGFHGLFGGFLAGQSFLNGLLNES